MIPPQSPMTTTFLLSFQTSSMMPGNITNSIESNTMRTVTTTTAARMVDRTRIGIVIFPAPYAQFPEPMDTDV